MTQQPGGAASALFDAVRTSGRATRERYGTPSDAAREIKNIYTPSVRARVGGGASSVEARVRISFEIKRARPSKRVKRRGVVARVDGDQKKRIGCRIDGEWRVL